MVEELSHSFHCLECNSSCAIVHMKGTFQICFKRGRSGNYCNRTPCRFHPFSKHTRIMWSRGVLQCGEFPQFSSVRRYGGYALRAQRSSDEAAKYAQTTQPCFKHYAQRLYYIVNLLSRCDLLWRLLAHMPLSWVLQALSLFGRCHGVVNLGGIVKTLRCSYWGALTPCILNQDISKCIFQCTVPSWISLPECPI